jgi:hypothetical protein
MNILPEWMEGLPLQQQAVLILALRGPDGFPKFHASKPVLHYYRACVLKAAHVGRHLKHGEHVPSLMSRIYDDEGAWRNALKAFRDVEDELPLHYYTHLMHGAQVLAFKHEDGSVRVRWLEFYTQCCDYLHVPCEGCFDMDRRLSDFGRGLEEILD